MVTGMTDNRIKELTRRVALVYLDKITGEMVRHLEEEEAGIDFLFECRSDVELCRRMGLASGALSVARCDEALALAAREMDFIERHGIDCLYMFDAEYPVGLIDMVNPPKMLFRLGKTDLNAPHSISMVGTRKCTPYGSSFCARFIEDLHLYFPDLCVISGLAYGVDAACHRAALERGLPTVGVVAHGLDRIYPPAHRDLAREMIASGGAVLTEYPSGTSPFPSRFLERNRIVACMSKGVFVVESELKGGAMSTATTAFSYNHEVFALPGRATDIKSSGCNHLIRTNKASLATCAADVMEHLGWNPAGLKLDYRQRNLFPELDGDVKKIYDAVRCAGKPMTFDDIRQATQLPVSVIMGIVGEMEFDGLLMRLPGNRFEVTG